MARLKFQERRVNLQCAGPETKWRGSGLQACQSRLRAVRCDISTYSSERGSGYGTRAIVSLHRKPPTGIVDHYAIANHSVGRLAEACANPKGEDVFRLKSERRLLHSNDIILPSTPVNANTKALGPEAKADRTPQ
jgi:hypothetical protein